MTPAEVAAVFMQFKEEVDTSDDDALLDLWIGLQDKTERVPDLDLLKAIYLEGFLHQKFGLMSWRTHVEARRRAVRTPKPI